MELSGGQVPEKLLKLQGNQNVRPCGCGMIVCSLAVFLVNFYTIFLYADIFIRDFLNGRYFSAYSNLTMIKCNSQISDLHNSE